MTEPTTQSPIVGRVVWFISVGVFIGLALIMLHGNGQLLNSQIKVWGESIWPGYNTLFTLGEPPACKLEERIRNRQRAEAALANPNSGDPADDDEIDELFDEEGSGSNEKGTVDDVDALFDEGENTTTNRAVAKDEVDDLFDDEEESAPSTAMKQAREDALKAAKAAEKNCRVQHENYRSQQAKITDGVTTYRSIHVLIEKFVVTGTNYYKHFLVIILLLCGIVTSLRHHHIALRPVEAGAKQLVASGAQLTVHGLLLYSFYVYREIQQGTVDADLARYWMVGLSLLCLINLYHVLTSIGRISEGLSPSALLSMPLYCIMAISSGVYFIFVKDYPSGLAAKLGLISVNAKLYLQVGLYVWVGMLLKNALVTRRVFDLFRPLQLAPELLAIVVVLGSAVPTAYSGASGIFVIAAGAIIYDELRLAGSRKSLALASTAMSGSLGVVLSPCLLVVIVASLDNSVTTDELFGWGARVFVLTALLFAILVLLTRRNPLSVKWDVESRRDVGIAARKLLPYISAFTIGLGFCYFVLGAKLDELWAPYLLPIFMFIFLVYERKRSHDPVAKVPLERGMALLRIGAATRESSLHIGALLFLMGMSVTLGAMVEDAELMEAVSVDFSNVWLTMSILLVVLVLVGMTMDPYGAVILVAATISAVARNAGIDMIHFWMVVLVAFELGYLTPPVALNHLLTRQVVDEHDFDAEDRSSFYRRHERYLLPIVVLGAGLIIVAYVPLLFY